MVICLGEHEFLPQTVDKLVEYLKCGGRLCLTFQQAAQLGGRRGRLQADGVSQVETSRENGLVRLEALGDPSER